MICFSYAGQGATLCGAPIDHEADMKDGKLCEECIKVMWLEQHRRNMLMPYIRKARKIASSGPTDLIPEVTGDPEMESQDDSPLYLSAYEIET
tara:strand:- start:213 stop:491 length:279 start_codon:yes stop_codon:yes gene_type:complete